MLDANKAWAQTLLDLHGLQHNGQAMYYSKFSVTTKDQVSLYEILETIQLDDLAKALHPYSHVEDSNVWLKKVQKLNPAGGSGQGCPKTT